MTAPDKIYAWSQENSQWGPQWKCCPEPMGPTVEFKRTGYTRTDLIQAQVAAAYEAAVKVAYNLYMDALATADADLASDRKSHTAAAYGIAASAIRTLTPADATAAMQAAIDNAVAAERERCAQVCDAVAAAFLSPEYATGQPISSFDERFACDEVKDAIRKGAKP